MKRTFLLVALLAIFGSAFAGTCYIVDNSTTIYKYSTAGVADTPVTTSLNYNARGIDLYNDVLTTVTGGARSWNNVTLAGVVSDVSQGWPFRGWAGVIDQATGEYYMMADVGSGLYCVRFADTLGNSPVYPASAVEQGYSPGADAEIYGGNFYGTSGTGNTDSRYLWQLPLGYTSSTNPVAVYDADPNGKQLSGIAFDGSGNVYLGVNNDRVIKLNSSFVYQSDLITGLSNVTDVDFFDNELYVCDSNGVEVYNLSGTLQRTFGPSNATGLVIGGGAAPPTTITFTGTVTVTGWMGVSLPSVSVTVDAGTPVTKSLTGSGDTGTFTVDLPNTGLHSVQVKSDTNLSNTLNGTTPTWAADTFVLGAGDATGDNTVDDFDFAAVVLNFGGAGPTGDCTGDGVVDDFDFAAVVLNFGSVGN